MQQSLSIKTKSRIINFCQLTNKLTDLKNDQNK